MEEAKVDHVLLVTWLRVGDSTEWITGWPGWIEAIRMFKTNCALSRRKQGFESPRERQCDQILDPSPSVSVQQLSNKRLWTGMDGMQIGQHVRSVWPYHSDLGATLRLAHLCGIAGCAGVTWLRTRRRARALMDNG